MASSSMLTREQRWVPGRRSCMTVLGKIAVPKPVNLPSQRLENHGLDPNVEIVPKGTPGWGSRSSSTTANAWGSSALSPSTPDGGAGSPSFLTGRPSSGGSGTRPSTAGSDKSCDTAPNAWGPNSRPSSACGTLTSSQTLVTSTRPRSAETRPSSSHLSRFAESNSDSSSAWSRPGTAEKLGTASAKVDGFTMSSGDFPTLGSGKSSDLHTHRDFMSGHSSHGRPLSASGRAAPQSDTLETSQNGDGSADASTEKGNVNTWKRDESPCHGGLAPPSMEKCQSDPQLPQMHPNLHMPPHHIDPWHGLPILNPPEGAWHRGGHPGVPYGPAFPPGSYSHQHLGYYHSQLPSRPTSNLQAGSNPGVRPGSCQLNSGDAYHPHLPDSYIFPNHPVIPVRPGAYTGPPPNGYYVPPRMNFRSSNEQFHSTEMIAGPRVYNRHSNQNAHPDINKYHARPVRYDPTSTMANEQMPSAHSQDTHRGPYKVLLKQHDAWGEKDATDGKKQDSMLVSLSHSETVRPSGLLVEENDLEGKWKKDEQIDFSKSSVGEDVSFHHTNDQRGCSSVPSAENLPDNVDKAKVLDEMKRPETTSIPAEGSPPFIGVNKNATLIDKIERLNTKARNYGRQNEVGAVNVVERNQFKSESVKANCSTNSVDTNVISTEKTLELDASRRDTSMSLKSITGETVSPRPTESQVSVDNMPDSSGVGDKGQFQLHKKVHSMQGRMDYRGKGKFNVQGGEGWRKKSSAADSSVVVTARDADACLDNFVEDRHTFQEVPTKQESKSPGNAEVEYCATRPFDSASYKAKEAKMKERAMQHARTPQQEAWVKEQKANAPAELGELNRQKVAENPSEKLESNAHQHGREDFRAHVKTPKTDACITEAVGLAAQNIVKIVGESTEVLLSHKASEVPNCAPQLSVPLPQDSNATDYASHRTISQLHDHGASRQKHMGHKRKQSNSQTKNLGNMAVTDVGMKDNDAMIADGNVPNGGSSRHDTTSITDDTLLQYKKKNNRSAKNKHRLDDVSFGATVLPSSQPIEGNLAKASSGISKVESSEPVLQPSSIQAETPREIDELGALRPAVEAHGRGSNQGKPQSSSKMSRSAQSIKVMEKLHGNEGVVWAPVRPLNKNGPLEEAGQSAVSDGNHHHSAKNGHEIQSSLRTKRVETERYIPKHRVKEQSEQEKSQQLPTFHSQEMSDEMAGSVECGSHSTKSSVPDSSAVKESFMLETRNVEGKHNKHRPHASWRRRGSVESPMSLQTSHDGSSVPSDASKTVQKPVEQDQHLKTDNPIPKGQQKYSDSGWNAHERATEDSALAVVEDHGTLGKGRLQPYKVHRAAGHKYTAELKNAETGAADKPDTHQTLGFSGLGRSASGNENRGLKEHESYQWEPKSHSYSSLDHQGVGGNRGPRSQVQVGRTQTPEKEFSSQGMGHFPSQTSKDSSATSQSQPHRHDSRVGNVAEIANMQQQDSRRERKRPDSSKEHAPNHGPASLAEPATETIDRHQEQQISSGPRQYGHQNARFSRRRETSYRGGQGPASETIRQPPVLNRDGRHQNLHYEYLPVRSAGKPSNVFNHNTDAGEETGQGSRVTGTRYQEQGQNQSRHRGHVYRRNVVGGPNTSVQEASAHDNGE
ncbi:protein MODIFIER OF SNC1 1 [Cinnamomum micranthum f. kanehirae]|uniref:Protein MODIFIER OF SNC1 1 n=1 Tax=Cinnamomum micranthum f. kanehirae TaxID=337451 RepID=A0A3S3N7V8_9MAGN|nr:protein MODIFIER OF SNC1 1 [Cinnamomum micranthum f. kanehirae]